MFLRIDCKCPWLKKYTHEIFSSSSNIFSWHRAQVNKWWKLKSKMKPIFHSPKSEIFTCIFGKTTKCIFWIYIVGHRSCPCDGVPQETWSSETPNGSGRKIHSCWPAMYLAEDKDKHKDGQYERSALIPPPCQGQRCIRAPVGRKTYNFDLQCLWVRCLRCQSCK